MSDQVETRRWSVASAVIIAVTIIGGLDLLLDQLASAYNVSLPLFSWVHDWGVGYGLDATITPYNVLLALELAWAAYFVNRVGHVVRMRVRERRARASTGAPSDLEQLDEGLDALYGPRHPPSDPNKLTEDDIDQIIVHWRQRKQKTWYVIRTIILITLGVVVIWTVVNLLEVIGIILTLLLILQLIVLLHQTYPALMAELYGTIAACVIILWAVPYRMSRKVLKVVQEGHTNTLGRVVFIRGSDNEGEYTPGIVYGIWYGLNYLRVLFRGQRKEWEAVKPSPHEVPMGNPFYLLGNQDTRHLAERFQREILYQDNTRGWLDRHRHPTSLWTNSTVEVSAWGVNLIGDGANILSVPRKGYDGVTHQELTRSDLTEHERKIGPYQQRMLDTLVSSKTLVAHGVRSDPELGKEAVHRFVLPSHEMILGRTQKFTPPGGGALMPPILPGSSKDKKARRAETPKGD